MPEISIRRAAHGNSHDQDGMVDLSMARATETNESHLADRSYAQVHVMNALASGPCFLAETNNAIIGVVTAHYVDLAYRSSDALEITHTYVLPEHRRYSVVSKLFDAVEAYADEHSLPVCFHELNWTAAIKGEPSEGHRVEKLYKFRKYAGPIISSHMRYPAANGQPARFRHVGRAYLYRPKGRPDAALPVLPDVRYRRWIKKKPATA